MAEASRQFNLAPSEVEDWVDQAKTGRAERLIRTLNEQCVNSHRFEALQQAMRVIGDGIHFYNQRLAHQVLAMKTPAETYATTGGLAA